MLLHLGVAVLLLRAATADGRDRSLDHELEDEREPAPEQEPLGIEESDTETLTWIGYEEYREHLARLSEVEQAAMLTTPVAGGGGTPPPSRPPSSPPTPTTPTADLPSSAAPTATTTAPAPETTDAEVILAREVVTETKTVPTVDPKPIESETIDEATTSDAEATPDPSTRPDPETTTTEDAAPEEPTPVPPVDESSDPQTDSKPPPVPQPDPGPAPEPAPKPTPKPTPEADGDEGDTKGDATGEGDGPGEPATESGNDADKDAEATSLIKVPASEWKQGKPLAAQGLNITTRRPQIPPTGWLSYRPKYNPVARIEFDRTGKPKRASLLVRSEEPNLDERLIDMLYRWRAKGARLRKLTGDQTVTIEIQLLLN